VVAVCTHIACFGDQLCSLFVAAAVCCDVRCREWNTNTRNAHLAQVLLQAVLKSHSPEQILEVPGGCSTLLVSQTAGRM
jgi:hypothetical protein